MNPATKRTEKFYEGDFEIESVIANLRFDFGEALGDIHEKAKKPTATDLDVDMLNAIAKCRQLGMTEEELRYSIEFNLRTYGYDDKTFPIDRWLA